MQCPVCKYNAPISQWLSLKDQPDTKNVVSPRINYYSTANTHQYDKIYACPKCGVCRIRKVGDR